MRIVESSRATNWATLKDPSLNNVAVDELGLLLKGHGLRGDQKNMVPNRSGSAPPSMEGSFVAFGNLMAQHGSGLDPTLARFSSSTRKYESEEQLRADPAYSDYYYSNVNLNPRLPPPIIARENRRLVSHAVGLGDNWRSTSYDDSGMDPCTSLEVPFLLIMRSLKMIGHLTKLWIIFQIVLMHSRLQTMQLFWRLVIKAWSILYRRTSLEPHLLCTISPIPRAMLQQRSPLIMTFPPFHWMIFLLIFQCCRTQNQDLTVSMRI